MPTPFSFFKFNALVLAVATFTVAPARADDWPQFRGPKRDGVWRETGILDKFPAAQLKAKWRAPIASGYSGPTVADGRVYVTDRLVDPKQLERVHCFDAKTGESIWSHVYDAVYRGVGYQAGPRASVSVDAGRAYSLGSMGHLFALDAATGSVLWRKDLNAEYKIRMPMWGIACSPLVEKDLLIVVAAGEKACVVAFDKVTGQQRWTALEDDAQYSAPIVIDQAGKRILVVWTGNNVVGLDVQSGEVYWKHPLKVTQMPIGIASPVIDGDRLFVSSFYDGSLMLKLDRDQPSVKEIWRRKGPDEKRTDSLHAMIGTPYFEGDFVYGVDSHGELRCLDAKTGDRVWENLNAVPKARWGTIHMVKHGDRQVLFNERGELIFAKFSEKGYEEISRAKLLEPTTDQLPQRGGVCWSPPAFADKQVFARNDKELICVSLAAE